jgi:starvation-inducible DNA-binding protein
MNLSEALRTVVIGTGQMSLHARGAHWNVTGPEFPAVHEFLGELYADLDAAWDTLAEDLRTLDALAPADAEEYASQWRVEGKATTSRVALLKILVADNDLLRDSIQRCYKAAEEAGECGISNRMQDRELAHAKIAWMLKSQLE